MSNRKKAGEKRGSSVLTHALLKRHIQAGRMAEAVETAKKMLASDQNDSAALRVCAEVALASGSLDDAKSYCERLVDLRPGDVWARTNLGVCLARMQSPSVALEQLLVAESAAPDDPSVCGHMSSLYFSLRDFEKSLYYADKSIAGDPSNYSAHNARGGALLKLERYEEALLSLAKAIELYPGDYYEEAVNNLCLTLHDMRRYGEAYACLEEILLEAPDDSATLALLVHSAAQILQWSGFEARRDALLQAIRSSSPPIGISPFIYLGIPGLNRDDHRRLSRLAAETMLPVEVSPAPALSDLRAMLPVRTRIRIGYISADFHLHATSQLMVEVLEEHDRDRFEVIGYSLGPDDSSGMRRRVCAAFSVFHDIRKMKWQDAVELIRHDGIDILVDLKGWTTGARLEIQASRPAPIIVSWLGYPGTLGHPDMADYIIGDPFVTPLEHAGGYSESIIQMPHSYQPNDRRREIGEMPSRQSLGLPESAVVFCSFNQAYKISPDIFSVWCEILRQVPGSVLWLLQPDDLAMDNLRRAAKEFEFDASRIVFAPRCSLEAHLGRLQQASLALDTAPYGSHTTGSDALWVGVPLVTCPGETFASRVAASLLSAAGAPELIAESMGEYVELAVRLAHNPDQLAALRDKILRGRETCPLFDSVRFTRNLETAYEQAIADGRSGVRRAIRVEDVFSHAT